MAPRAACVRERRRTYAGCRDLHQTPPVLAAVSGGRQALRERDPPSFGPRQEDLRICFETPEYGQEPQGHASEAPCCIAIIIVRCNMAAARHGVKNLAGNCRYAVYPATVPVFSASAQALSSASLRA